MEIGKGATLLLHEATFDDELGAEARGKRHCTTSEALGAGKEMGARTVVLTHFSQRYPKLPVINGGGEEGEKGGGMEVALAFDGMRMRVGEIGRFRNFVPALRELYEERDEEEVVGGDGDGDGEAEADAAEMGEKVGRNAGKVGKKEKEVAPSKRQEKKEGNKERKENVRRERREKAQGQVGQAHQHQHQQGGCCAEPQKEEVVVVATESEDVVPAPETEQIQPAKTPLRKKALPGYF